MSQVVAIRLDKIRIRLYSSDVNETMRSPVQHVDPLPEGLLAVRELIEQRLDAAVQPHVLSLAKLAVSISSGQN